MESVEYELMDSLEGRFWWYRALHAVVLQRIEELNLAHGACILDAGCGTGGMLHHILSSATAQRCNLFGLEWNADAARTACNKTGLPIAMGSVNSTPFCDNAFDIILSQDVLYHNNVDQTAALLEFYRCLKPRGHLLLSLPAYNWMSSTHDVCVHGARRYTAGSIRQLLSDGGFEPVRVGYWNSLLFPLMAAQRMTAGKIKKGSDVKLLPDWLDSLLFKVLDSERLLRLQLPFGGSAWAIGIKT
jgi:SAM-dependent methyltransferase